MDFIENIQWYYTTEAKHGIINSAVTGAIILVLSIIAWRMSLPSSLLRGIAIALSFGTLIFVLGGTGAGYVTRKSLPEKVASYQQNREQFLLTENHKVEKIHNNWLSIKIFWTVVALAGIILIFMNRSPLWLGVGVGILIVGTLGHIEEAVSYQHNEKYKLLVNEAYNKTGLKK